MRPFFFWVAEIREGIISLEYIASSLNLADIFTKVVKLADFIRHRDTIVKDPVQGS